MHYLYGLDGNAKRWHPPHTAIDAGNKENYLMRRTTLSDDNVPRYTTNCDTVWIEKLAVMFPARTKVELKDSVTVKHLYIASSNWTWERSQKSSIARFQ